MGCSQDANAVEGPRMTRPAVGGVRQASPSRVVIVTNAPAPYRSPVFARLGDDYEIVFCAASESNRSWGAVDLNFRHRFIPGRVHRHSDGYNYIYFNWAILSVLSQIDPDVLITTGFNPTHLVAFAWAKLRSRPHIVMTDGTLASEAGLSRIHRLVRRAVFRMTSAFVVTGHGGRELLESYGVSGERVHVSRLSAPELPGAPPPMREREFDVLFCGQLHPRKAPLFFAEVCKALRDARGTCRCLIIGDGPLRAEVLRALDDAQLEYSYLDAVPYAEIGRQYARAKVLLFPTLQDAWGLVANEAFAAGTPVITTPEAGVSGDLVIDGVNGCIAPLDVDAWCELASDLLSNPDKWGIFSQAARLQGATFSYTAAAAGIESAVQLARHG